MCSPQSTLRMYPVPVEAPSRMTEETSLILIQSLMVTCPWP